MTVKEQTCATERSISITVELGDWMSTSCCGRGLFQNMPYWLIWLAMTFLLVTSVHAQIPGGGKAKAALQLQERVADGVVQDFIVVYDDKAIETEASALQTEAGLPSHHPRVLKQKSAHYLEKKSEVLAAVGLSEISVLKEYSHLPAEFVRIHSKEAFNRLLQHPGVVGIFEDRLERKFLAESLPLIGQPQAAAQGDLGAGTAIAVLDTGVDYTRSAFGSCTSPGVPANCKVIYAQDFAPSDGQLDMDGHGTNVAGIVLGVAPATKIIALDVFGATGTASSSDILSAINWVIANRSTYNIVAMNLSLGGGKYYSPETSSPYSSAIAQARAAGVLTVAAAGNDGFANALASPGATSGVVSVGAVYDSTMGTLNWRTCPDAITAADRVTCFSNSASFLTLLAPGSQILAAGITRSGTSMASPLVAGAVAVLRAAFPTETPNQTVARLTNGDLMTDGKNDITKPRLNLTKALGLATTCTYSLAETSKSFASNSASASVAVMTGAGCTWSAAASTGNATWIVVTSGSNGIGSGSVAYSVLANPNAASRSGTITVAGITYTVNQSGAVGTAANILLNPGFEDGPVAWIDSTANGLPVMTTYLNPTSANSWYAWLCGYDNCVDNIYQDVTIPADAQSASLQFNYWIDTAETTNVNAYDTMTVRIYSPANASTYKYWSLSNLNATTGWALSQKYDLSAYKGQTIRVQFTGTTDSSAATSFYLDDVNLTVSGSTPDTRAPGVPTGLKAVPVSANAINLTWGASTDNVGVTAYRVYHNGVFLATLGNVLSYRDSGLLTGTQYSYTVSACDVAGNCSAQSSVASAVTTAQFVDLQPPTVPTGLSATAISTSAINLTWTASTDNVGVAIYKIYRNGVLLRMLGSVVSYADTALTAATTYTYTVAACDAAGNCSAQSSAVAATTNAPFKQATPVVFSGPSSYQPNGNTVHITIDRINNNSTSAGAHSGSLRIELWALATPYFGGSNPGYKTASIRTVSIPGATDTLAAGQYFSNLVFDTTYTAPPAGYASYALLLEEYDPTNCTAADHFCVIDYLNYHEATPPTVPLGLTATAVSSSQINLSWTASTDNVGVATYKVYRGGVLIALLGNVTNYTDSGLNALSTYSYTVAACDAAGNCSAQSSPTSGTTLASVDTQAPTVPTGVNATVTSSTQIKLSWSASSDNVGVIAYKIYSSSGTLLSTLGNVLSSTRTNAPSSTYSYTVSACDAAGNCSAQSAVVTATTPAISDAQPPTVPTALTAVVANSTTVNLRWAASTDNVGVTSYKVYRDGGLRVTLGNITSYGDVGLKSSVYSYAVSACDALQNCSSQSASVSATVTTSPAPVCTLTATPTSITSGTSSTLTSSCSPAATSYIWTGGTCAGTTAAICMVTPTGTTTYSVAGVNSGGTGSAASASVTVTAPASRLINLSTRGQVQTGDNVMIGGFIIGGSTPKKVLVRAVGPNLANYGVSGVLADPSLQLYSGQTPIASNDDWGSASNVAEIQASTFAPVNAKESAILSTLNPGAYTAIVTGVSNGTGVGIVEVYELDHPEIPLINISTRGKVLTGDNVMIGGFIIQGDSAKTVLIRAVGPNLANYGVTGVLANPKLQLYSGQTVVATNDDWGTSTNAADITATGLAPADAKESAILITLQPGAYTAIVSGADGGSGVGIVEVFAQ